MRTLLCLLAAVAGCSSDAPIDPARTPDAAATATPDAGTPAPDGPSATAVARIVVTPGSVLLTPDRASAALTATAYNAFGTAIDATITWTSSRPEQIAVDATGRVQAMTALGSATIHAEAQGVQSAAALVARVEPRPGALLVSDAQVVAVGKWALPPGAPPDGYPELDLRLRDVTPPAAGAVVLAVESSAIAGVVVSAEAQGAEVAVRLRAVALPELFDRYDLQWDLLLADYDVVMDGETAAKPRPLESKIEKEFPARNSPLKCTIEGSVSISQNLVDLKLTGDAKLVYKSTKDDPSLGADYLKVALEGPLTLTGFIGLKIEAGMSGKAKCELTGEIRIPLLGWFSAIWAPAIPLGVGVALDGKLTAVSFELGLEGENGFDFGLGFECGPGTAPCHSLDRAELINKFKPRVSAPSMPEMKVEIGATAYFITGLNMLFFAGLYDFKAIHATFGPAQTAKLAFVDVQAEDAGYASKYELKAEGKIGLGQSVQNAIKKLLGEDKDVASLGAEFTISRPISRSPMGTMTVDRPTPAPGEKVTFTIDLDAASVVYFLLGYNVEAIELRRRKEDEPLYEHIATVEPTSSNQTSFKWEWTPTRDDIGKWQYHAFVKTRMPVISLEIAEDSRRDVEVVGICSAKPGAKPDDCELNGTVSHTLISNSVVGSANIRLDASVRLVQEPTDGDIDLLVFRPMGGWTLHHSGSVGSCTFVTMPGTVTGTLSGTEDQGTIVVNTLSDPPNVYAGLLATGIFDLTTTMTCPDMEPITMTVPTSLDLFNVVPTQNFVVDEETHKLVGSYTVMSDDGFGNVSIRTWTWDLTLSE